MDLRAEVDRLREDNARLKTALVGVQDLIGIAPAFFGFVSTEGVVEGLNDLALQVIEATREQVIGRLFWEAAWWAPIPASALFIRQAIADAAAGRAAQFDLEYWAIRAAHGHKRWVALTITPERDAGGRVGRIAVAGVDITERVETEAALHRSEEQLSKAVAVSRIGFFDWDIAADQVTYSAQMQRDWGIDRPGRLADAVERIHLEDREEIGRLIEQAITAHAPYHAEYRVVRPDGKTVWIEAQGEVEYDAQQRPVRFFGTSIDVSDRRRILAEAETARREADLQRAYLTRVFNQVPLGVGIFRGERNLVALANPAACRLWGRTQADLIGQPIFDVVPEGKNQGFEELLVQVRQTGEPFMGRELPATLARPEGGFETVFLDVVYQPLRAADGTVTDIVSIVTDVTARVLAHREAETSNAQFEAMFNGLPDGAFLGDETGILRANRAGLALLGIDRIEMLGTTADDRRARSRIREVVGGQPVPHGQSPFERALAGEVVRDEYVLRNLSEGKDVFVRSAASPIRIGGAITGAAVFLTDITEQHRAIEALRRSEENFRTLAESLPDAVWVADPGGGVQWTNSVLPRATGRSPDEIRGDGYRALVHPDDALVSLASWDRATESGTPFEVQHRLRQADGRWRWHLVRGRPVRDGEGAIYRWIGTSTDIHDQRELQGALERSRAAEQELRREAEEANRSKDEFLAMLGHELRNPLAPIFTALQLMKLRADDSVAKERAVIQRQIDHLARLVDDLLDVSRITQGKIELNKQRLEMSTAIAGAIEIASPLLEQRRHHLSVEVEPQGLAIDGDRGRLAQAVSNLLTNAAKYTDPGGHVSVRAAREGDEVVVRVKDDGVGISPQMLSRVFDLFTQERQSIDRARGGLGLGLAIVRALVEMHGGTISVQSAGRDRGTTFTLRLPAAGPAASAERALGAPAGGRPALKPNGRRVLIVDDNLDAAEGLADMLEFMGHETRVAGDGPAALAIVQSFQPDLAVLDIGLPVMDGYELARRLREVPSLQNTRLVALTGYGRPSDRDKSLQNGFDAHLVKPIHPAHLEALLLKPTER